MSVGLHKAFTVLKDENILIVKMTFQHCLT